MLSKNSQLERFRKKFVFSNKGGMENGDSFDSTLKILALTLQEAATQNELLVGPNITLTRFHTLSPPKIPILKYLRYLKSRANCSETCFIIAMILLDKLLQTHSHIHITPNTVHKLFLCSLMTAAKFNTDTYYSNSVWASIGGVRAEEMNVLELEFLFLLQFSLVITKEEYETYDREIRLKASYLTNNYEHHKYEDMPDFKP